MVIELVVPKDKAQAALSSYYMSNLPEQYNALEYASLAEYRLHQQNAKEVKVAISKQISNGCRQKFRQLESAEDGQMTDFFNLLFNQVRDLYVSCTSPSTARRMITCD